MIKGLQEFEKYELLFSFKQRSFSTMEIRYWCYKGKKWNVCISNSSNKSWCVGYGTGNTRKDYKECRCYAIPNKIQAIRIAIHKLEEE